MNHQINIGFETAVEDEAEVAALIRTCALRVLESEGVPFCAEIDVTVVNADTVREMNAAYRDKDAVTDVLSFPMVDYPSPASFDFLETEEGDDCFNPDSGELMLGDIVISVARARAQAEEYGHSLRREFAFLVAHSMLHLLGYDHMTPEEAAVMEAKQEEVLQRLGITRD